MRRRVLQEGDILFCLSPVSIANPGCFYTGGKYKVTGVVKKRGHMQQAYVTCEGQCEHSFTRDYIKLYFRIPNVIIRNLPQWL